MQQSLIPQTLDYLTFAPGVRLHWSEVRQQYWLLFPEAALALNSTAAAILAKCDGNNSLDEILTVLKQQYCDVNVSDVENLLLSVFKRGLLIRSAC
ncbi:coenzyme PQQ synthesis protein D [Calothrix parasitica NIES-267]|uniref:Coenzyme PQQ synthesis protein D n=1 Tax=Calothrix parasitica NIES-267 TaxID=1973488 RepID=A0A1Z4LUJ9_9CYAN|nr:coenzyme PQQ synthesis protein D [Calothrix parasitica NIES-267]